MNTYEAMKNAHKIEVNEFPIFFAFNDAQFKKGMEGFGLDPEKDTDKVYSIPGGGVYRRSDSQRLHDMLDRHEKELKEMLNDESSDFAYSAFLHELANHEYCITHDPEPTLESLLLEEEEFAASAHLQNEFCRAKKEYLEKAFDY